MNPQENRDDDRILQKLEAQLNQNRIVSSLWPAFNRSQSEVAFNQVVNWFNGLANPAKVAVVAIAVLVGFSVVKSILQLVASLIGLAILGIILYLVYKFLITPQSSN